MDSRREHGGGAVQHVASGDLLRAGLQQRILLPRRATVLPQDAEDGADCAAHIEIGRPVERIEQHAVLAVAGLVIGAGEIFGGVASRTYAVPAIPPGTYRFLCDVHPTMVGTLIATVSEGYAEPGPAPILAAQ